MIDILEAVAIEFPCNACGERYQITLMQVLLSQRMLHEGCPVPSHFATECPPPYYADLVDRQLIEELRQKWQRLEEKARAAGGDLILWSSQNRR
jgi:hypothetical protein